MTDPFPKNRANLKELKDAPKTPEKLEAVKRERTAATEKKAVANYLIKISVDAEDEERYEENRASASATAVAMDSLSGEIEFSLSQGRKGTAGAEARWRYQGGIKQIIERLAVKRDALGDFLDPSELWTDFYSALEESHLNPVEKANPRCYVWDDTNNIKYSAFRRRIQRIRNGNN